MVLKRVRREIRDLPLNEWNDVVDAMWIMKRTEDIDGKKKYGRFFISYDTLVAKHITASLDPRGDQAHFGPVLGLFHRGWLLQLENSLIAINPNIKALPYWDYGRDINPSAPGHVDIFSDQYFGSFVGRGPDYAVIDGKFAKWPVARYSSTHGKYSWQNPYGFLRHPLSVNKSPFVTRNGGSMCGFSLGLGQQDSWDQCLNVGDAIMDWSMCVDSRVHGPAHSSIAGTWRRDGQDHDSPNCAQWYGFIGAPNSVSRMGNLRASSPYPYGTFISPYSAGCFTCPRCQLSDNPSDCMCTPSSSSCGPLWTQLRMPNTLRTGSRFIDTSRMSTLISASEIQILGDLGDPAGSPNDPM